MQLLSQLFLFHLFIGLEDGSDEESLDSGSIAGIPLQPTSENSRMINVQLQGFGLPPLLHRCRLHSSFTIELYGAAWISERNSALVV